MRVKGEHRVLVPSFSRIFQNSHIKSLIRTGINPAR